MSLVLINQEFIRIKVNFNEQKRSNKCKNENSFYKKNKQKIYFQVEKMKNLKFVKYKFPMN